MNMPRVFMYLRKSCESEDRQALSIPAQESILRGVIERKGLKLVGRPIKESRSAKVPGRPAFGSMLEAIQMKKADGILCWHLDRLARNPLDGGALMWALGQGTIKAIHTPDRTYTGTGDDKLMMSIIFGMATKYSDDLSQNVKRGNRQALERGFWPGCPKMGYLRDHDTMRIIIDPKRFNRVREMWRMKLSGMSIREILHIANTEWGLRTPRRGRQGGSPICHSHIYKLFRDPFYAGVMKRAEGSFPGTHTPVITLTEFEQVQAQFNRHSNSRPKAHWFAYRGLLSCGACGSHVTAEHTLNHQKKPYVYYHCVKKQRPDRFCPEPYTQEKIIERQMSKFLKKQLISPKLISWGLDRMQKLNKDIQAAEKTSATQIHDLIRRKEYQLARLNTLILDEVIDTNEYTEQKKRLLAEISALREQQTWQSHVLPTMHNYPIKQSILYDTFEHASQEMRRELVSVLFAKAQLKNRRLRFEMKPLFAAHH